MRQYILAIIGLVQFPSLDVGKDGFLSAIEADHFRNMHINGLVIGDTGTHSVGKGDIARPVRPQAAPERPAWVLTEGGGSR